MSTNSATKTAVLSSIDARIFSRIFEEGYGPGAWHGPDLKAALADVTRILAFWRPAPGRHNIAEIAVHHAYYLRSVRAQLSEASPEPFTLEGEDWFELSERGRLSWAQVQSILGAEHQRLADLISKNGSARNTKLSDAERLDLVLGITCHDLYHAGQVQLLKRLHDG